MNEGLWTIRTKLQTSFKHCGIILEHIIVCLAHTGTFMQYNESRNIATTIPMTLVDLRLNQGQYIQYFLEEKKKHTEAQEDLIKNITLHGKAHQQQN